MRIAPSAATIHQALNTACPGGPANLHRHNPASAENLAADGNNPVAGAIARSRPAVRRPRPPGRARPSPG
ncbi:hypothetical protein H0E86_14295 [Streptomyces sp. SCSIO-PteL053]|nr:hypothetical protein H0E86_14295 [Streptomyces sp. SCSIO-PteL053]